jgi:hypothetical protein
MVTGMTAGDPRGTGNRDPSDVFIRRVFILKSGCDRALIFDRQEKVFSIHAGAGRRFILAV